MERNELALSIGQYCEGVELARWELGVKHIAQRGKKLLFLLLAISWPDYSDLLRLGISVIWVRASLRSYVDYNCKQTVMVAEYCIVHFRRPGQPAVPIGVLLFDVHSSYQFGCLFRRDWTHIADPEDADILSGMGGFLRDVGLELGAGELLRRLEDSWSNSLTISERKQISSLDTPSTLKQLYEEYVQERA
mgnify:CR=1 FL=1